MVALGSLALAGRPERDGAGGSTGSGADKPLTASAVVTRRDLVERDELDATLGYGATTVVSVPRPGTVTALAGTGTVVDRGQVLAEVDERPTVVLIGARPAWRSLSEGVADGADVAQIEENLVTLGHGSGRTLTVDETWTAATTAAVKRWETTLGVSQDGIVELGDVVFLPGAVRVVTHEVDVGGAAGGPVVSVSSTARTVTVDLDARRQALMGPGQAVEVVLADGTVVGAAVASVATVVDPPASEGASATVKVVITLEDESSAGGLDQAPVTVRVVAVAASAVLTVPLDALLALAEGGYAVERAPGDDAGSGIAPDLVAVELGAFADGFVEVTGALSEGDEVVVPA